ncbi:pseudouridine synthase [Luteimonas sp. MHLX1A]|uniref:pseudouridine synthase n=1 Tax=Alterluteimonas muca TaxID=2878684 RepID=UPI001E522BCC|nr:pseudouridine synthase [Luteimonas sp. MHLX1A]MCD9045240.1 pseudouridylate synthase [Luteimonas sp. MHLX1A]
MTDSIPVLHADDLLAVVDKPAGLAMHDSRLARGEPEFLVDRLRAQFDRPVYLAHRLDRATSGCVLVAFDREVAGMLGEQLMSRTVDKEYLAVCRGWPAEVEFTVDHPLDGGPGKPLKKPATTSFERLATVELPMPTGQFDSARYALLRARPLTGRFRQIRRHLKHLSHHLIGDTSHGDGRHNRNFRMLGIHRMLLHASALSFRHPGDGRALRVECEPSGEFTRALALFEPAPAERPPATPSP